MKSAIALILVSALAANAYPYYGFPLGYLQQMFGGYGNQMGGGGFGSDLFNRGYGGRGQMGWLNNGMGENHNVGGHNTRISNIQQAEDNGFHNIGSEGSFNNGGGAANGYGGYDNGAGLFGNNFGAGGGGMSMMG